MISKNSFHQYTIQQEYKSLTADHWKIQRRSKRDVDYRFFAHYHPYTEELIEKLNTDGLIAMLDVNYVGSLKQSLTPFYTPGSAVTGPFPKDEIDVSDDGPYAVYNWELFFHAPLSIAVQLSKNQRFAESQRWFHFIFDPTSNDKTIAPPQRFWKFLRFRQETKTQFIQEMLVELAKAEDSELKQRVEKSIQAWRDKPFQPHVIARGRYLAYQLSVVMKYLDNLISWGDSLFRQDTIETLNEATQVYVLAANILGLKPQKVPPRGKTSPKTYAQLKAAGIDKFGNALIEMENDFPFNISPTSTATPEEGATNAVFGIARTLYFCIPQNDKLLGYWDTVADRLFKIRHCMNIEGIVRQLPLFEPPIDPGMLVKAVAAGMDIGSIINNINQPISNIRGPMLLQKAMEICGEVKSLGGALLSAIEKGESEHLGLLRHQNEIALLEMIKDVKFLQWKETEASTEALLKSRDIAGERFRHYKLILGNKEQDINKQKAFDLARKELTEDTFDDIYRELVEQYAVNIAKEAYRQESSVGGIMEFAGNVVTSIAGGQLGKTLPLNKNENAELNVFLPASDTFGTISMGFKFASPILALIPQFNAHATPLGVGAAATFGGVQLEKAATTASEIADKVSKAFASSAERASKMAGYYRKAEEFVFQANLAASELMQYGRQIISSLIREQVMRKEYENHLIQIEQAKSVETFLQEKFTKEELYSWMQGEISRIYFDSYKFAFDIAKRAEQTMKFELMRKEFDDLSFIKFGYWDSARKGLLSGEALYLDLKRLEMAYHDQNRREYEMVKHVSIQRLDPMTLLKLKASGSCEIKIPEWVFDMDCPGQYMRRIKSVAVSIPCIAGPYTGIHCKLSLLQSSIRISSLKGDAYPRTVDNEDSRFRDFAGSIQTIVTSTAQNDSGLFETNLRDERYLPFEGAGVISNWRMELPNDIPQFDFETISDVILHIRYTAREAGHLKADVVTHIKEDILQSTGNLLQLLTLNHDFATAWHSFVSENNDAVRKLEIKITKDSFPYWTKPLGMDDLLKATFGSIDWKKNRLTLAPQQVDFTGDEATGWSLVIDKDSPVFAFLKKNKLNKVHMGVVYAMKS
ncbi:MAG: toxin [Chitinophagaceae bacterium]|nr:toxin [Chitinophagaceae bacterium]